MTSTLTEQPTHPGHTEEPPAKPLHEPPPQESPLQPDEDTDETEEKPVKKDR